MDMKERLERLKARRDPDNIESEGDEITPKTLAAIIADCDNPEELDEVLDMAGGLELYREYITLANTPIFGISNEDYKEALSYTLTRIIAFIKRWAKVLAAADLRLAVNAAHCQALVDTLHAEVRAVGHAKSGTFTLDSRMANLCINYRPMKDPVSLINGLTTLSRVVSAYFGAHTATVGAARGIIELTSNLTNVDGLTQRLLAIDIPSHFNSAVFRPVDGRIESLHLLGNHKLVVLKPDEGASPYDAVTATKIRIEMSQLTPGPVPTSIEFPHFDVTTNDVLTDLLSKIIGAATATNTGTVRAQRRQALNELTNALDRANNSIKFNDTLDPIKVKETAVLLETYIAWIADPYTDFFAYILRDVRAVINVCAGNISQ